MKFNESTKKSCSRSSFKVSNVDLWECGWKSNVMSVFLLIELYSKYNWINPIKFQKSNQVSKKSVIYCLTKELFSVCKPDKQESCKTCLSPSQVRVRVRVRTPSPLCSEASGWSYSSCFLQALQWNPNEWNTVWVSNSKKHKVL